MPRPPARQRRIITLLALILTALPARAGDAGWDHYGADEGGSRYSAAKEITPENVDNLIRAWEFSTGDLAKRDVKTMRRAKLQATPILVDDKLLMCSSFNEVIALDPGTGKQIWRFDPGIRTEIFKPTEGYNCRGVAVWIGDAAARPRCSRRVLTATTNARVIALDLETGQPCTDFGINGEVKIDAGIELKVPGEFQITSAPVVIGDIVVVGSAIGDNMRVKAPHGTVRAFDVVTGAPKWSWDPVPRDPSDPATATWGDGWKDVGHANVWAPISGDTKRGLVFLPTSSPSPDFFGGLRPGDNRHSNSVVALKAATGEVAWAFQTVHHDVWDYDNPAQPTLATIDVDGKPRDVVIQTTKQGFVFVLDRDTGVPVFPVEERAVPQAGAPGEVLSPTQPFPTHIPPLAPQKITADDAFGVTPWGRGACYERLAAARNEGLFTPPSEQGTIVFPFTGGGSNWGGISVDPVNKILYANTSRAVHLVTLFPAARFDELDEKYPDKEVSPQAGAPYGMIREIMLSPLGLPCNPPPWGVLSAVDLKSGKVLWEKPLGTTEDLAPLALAFNWGTPGFSGSLITAGGLVFIGATLDQYLRAFDAKTGQELWQGRLPASGMATPMTYEWRGRQFVVIAAGGRADAGVPIGDSFMAFALPKPGEPGPSLWSRTIDRPGGRMWVNLALLFTAVIVIIDGLRRLVRRWRN